MTISLQFLGAARQVTGSKHLLTVNDKRVLLDCGMVQGPRRLANRLNRELPFAAEEIDAVVLSHGHIDHSGSLPRLVKEGFTGTIHCTHATVDLLEIMLPDSAHLQESDARHLSKRGKRFEPAYDQEDVEKTLLQTEGWNYHEPIDVCAGVKATFIDAGHILGSAQVILDVDDGGGPLRIAFTGDLGRKNLPILRDPDPIPECDVLITESTYGDRLHPPLDNLQQDVDRLINEQRRMRGRILIPAFSVGRTQNILWYLGKMIRAGRIEPMPIYVDSPMSKKTTAAVAKHRNLYDAETQKMLQEGHDPFYFEGVRFVGTVEESKAMNEVREGILISASGMMEGGRVLHHLKQSVERPEDCVLIVGFQAQGTLGRKLLEGFEHVKIFGERYRVRCKVRYLDGLSAHADYSEMLEHLSPLTQSVKRVFVVHGEESAAMKFEDRLVEAGFRDVEVPLYRESFTLRP